MGKTIETRNFIIDFGINWRFWDILPSCGIDFLTGTTFIGFGPFYFQWWRI